MKKILYFAILNIFSLAISMDDLIETQLRNYIRQAEQAESRGNKDQALQWYGKAASVTLPAKPDWGFDPYEQARELQEKGSRKIITETMRLRAQKKYDEAIKVYRYAGDRFKTDIAGLESLKKAQKPKKVEKKEEWIFLREIDLPDKETSNWRIKDKRLELKASAEDSLFASKFTELIEEAQKSNVPYILVGMKKDNFYHFIDGAYLAELAKEWTDKVFTRAAPDSVEIFVAGEDGKLTFLSAMGQQRLRDYFFIEQPGWVVNYQIKEDFSKPGYGHLLIADLFKQQAESVPSGVDTRQINRLQRQVMQLEAEAEAAPEDRVMQIFKEVEELQKQIQKLRQPTENKEQQILLQHARKWYDWAMKYLPSFSPEYARAQRVRNKIPHKSELLKEPESRKKAEPEALMKSLQNLNTKLRQLRQKLA